MKKILSLFVVAAMFAAIGCDDKKAATTASTIKTTAGPDSGKKTEETKKVEEIKKP